MVYRVMLYIVVLVGPMIRTVNRTTQSFHHLRIFFVKSIFNRVFGFVIIMIESFEEKFKKSIQAKKRKRYRMILLVKNVEQFLLLFQNKNQLPEVRTRSHCHNR